MIKVRCPVCERLMEGASTAAWPEFPFCSARCRTIDLGRWLGERYRIAPEGGGEPPAEGEDDSELP